VFGVSVPSDDGILEKMLTDPDTITNLREDISARTASTLGLLWDDGSATGGSPIISY